VAASKPVIGAPTACGFHCRQSANGGPGQSQLQYGWLGWRLPSVACGTDGWPPLNPLLARPAATAKPGPSIPLQRHGPKGRACGGPAAPWVAQGSSPCLASQRASLAGGQGPVASVPRLPGIRPDDRAPARSDWPLSAGSGQGRLSTKTPVGFGRGGRRGQHPTPARRKAGIGLQAGCRCSQGRGWPHLLWVPGQGWMTSSSRWCSSSSSPAHALPQNFCKARNRAHAAMAPACDQRLRNADGDEPNGGLFQDQFRLYLGPMGPGSSTSLLSGFLLKILHHFSPRCLPIGDLIEGVGGEALPRIA